MSHMQRALSWLAMIAGVGLAVAAVVLAVRAPYPWVTVAAPMYAGMALGGGAAGGNAESSRCPS